MDNFAVVINKEKNYTSRDVVNKLNQIFKTKKIGHTGTLDPLATGVLVCLVGKYTKLVPYIVNEEKEYEATIKLGIKTDTLDITGKVMELSEPRKLNIEEIRQVLDSMIGEFEQTIPLYSAKHLNGKRLYEYARDEEEVTLPKNKVIIKEIKLLKYQGDEITFKCLVSKGTYIRSLIEAICNKLNVLGVMSELKRTKQGNFSLKNSCLLDDVANNNFKKLKIEDIFTVQVVDLEENIEKKVLNGNIIELNLDGWVLFKKDTEEVALYHFNNQIGHLILLLKN